MVDINRILSNPDQYSVKLTIHYSEGGTNPEEISFESFVRAVIELVREQLKE